MAAHKRVFANQIPKGGWRFPGMKKPWEHEGTTYKKRLEYQRARTLKRQQKQKEKRQAWREKYAAKKKEEARIKKNAKRRKERKKAANNRKWNIYKAEQTLRRNREELISVLTDILNGHQHASQYYTDYAKTLSMSKIRSVDPKVRKALFQACNVHIFQRNKDPKYNRQSIMLEENYNILEHYNTVRHFMQVRYGLSSIQLEKLFWLYPQTFFTRPQFNSFETRYGHTSLVVFKKQGLIELFKVAKVEDQGRGHEMKIYKLTQQAKRIVVLFHKYLSGEKPLPKNNRLNILLNLDQDANSSNRNIVNNAKQLTERLEKTRFAVHLSEAKRIARAKEQQ